MKVLLNAAHKQGSLNSWWEENTPSEDICLLGVHISYISTPGINGGSICRGCDFDIISTGIVGCIKVPCQKSYRPTIKGRLKENK
jgi:hypothetical protein